MRIRVERSSLERGESILRDMADELDSLRSQLRRKINNLEYESQRRGDVDGTVRELEQEMERLKSQLEELATFVDRKGKDFQFADDQGKPIKKSFWDFLKKIVGVVLDFLPIVSNIKGLLDAVLGFDIISGEKLSTVERLAVLFGPLGKGFKHGAKLFKHVGDITPLTKKPNKANDGSRSMNDDIPTKSDPGSVNPPVPPVLTGKGSAPSTSKLEPGKINNKSACGDPVHTGTGAQIIEHELLVITSVHSWKLALQYNSLLLQRGTIGRGWTHNYETRLEIDPDGQQVTIWWTKATNHQFTRMQEASNEANEDQGHIDTLSKRSPAKAGHEYRSADGDAYYDRLTKLPDGTFRLVRHSHEVYLFNRKGHLLSVQEEGYRLQAEHTEDGLLAKLTDELSGRYIEFHYREDKLVDMIQDSSGRRVKLDYNDSEQLMSIAHPNDHVVTFTYLNNGPIVTARKGNDLVFRNEYDEEMRVVRQQDGLGNWFHFEYDVQSRPGMVVTRFTDREGSVTVLVHDANYRIVEETDPLGSTTRWQYDDYGNMTQVTNPVGLTFDFRYDDNGRLMEMEDVQGTKQYTYNDEGYLIAYAEAPDDVTTFTRDAYGRMLTRTDAAGRTVSIAYDERGLVQTHTDVAGAVTSYLFDERGDLTQLIDPEGRSFLMQYDVAGRVASTQAPDGGEWKYVYDEIGNLLCDIDPLHRMRTYQYNTMGQLVCATDPSGASESYTYNTNGDLISRVNALGAMTAYEYDKEGRLVQMSDPLGVSIQYTYNAGGQIVQVHQGEQLVRSYQYDALGRRTDTLDAYGNRIEHVEYDEIDRPIAVTNALGATTKYVFNRLGEHAEKIDPLGNRVEIHLDALGRLHHVREAETASTRFEYDIADRLKAYIDAAGNRTDYDYDRTGRVVREARQTGDSLSFVYDAVGRLESRVDASGRTTRLSYDKAGQLIGREDAEGTIGIHYDENGRIVEVEETRLVSDVLGRKINGGNKQEAGGNGNVSNTQRHYDALGRVIAYTDVYGNEIKYAYDEADRLIKLTYPDGKVVGYGYDAAGRLSEVKDWAGRITKYEYDLNNQLIRSIRPNGTVELREYDAEGQLTLLTDLNVHGIAMQRFRLVYDASGQVIREEEKQYIYDNLKRLTSGAERGEVTHYSYDISGNITNISTLPVQSVGETASSQGLPLDSSVTSGAGSDIGVAKVFSQRYQYGADNRLSAVEDIPVEIDANGNLLYATDGKQVYAYVYDARNRLVEAGQLRYDYDAEGHRIGTYEQGRTIRHVISPIGELTQLLMETDEDGKPLAYYVYGLGLIGREDSRGYKSYHADMRGSTTLLTDEDGKITDRYRYGFYGEVEHIEGATCQPFQYNGRDGVRTDSNGLYDMRNRFYHPTLKRFLQRDVWMGRADETQSLNRYGYVQGNPVSFIDPLGLMMKSILNKCGLAPKPITNADKAHKWGNKHYSEWKNKLSNEQKSAIGDYVGPDYIKMNNHLRGVAQELPPGEVTRIKGQIDHVKSALNAAKVPHDITVYRGTSNRLIAEKINGGDYDSLIGQEVIEKGFLSTAVLKGVAADFSNGRVLWMINVPKGADGAYISIMDGLLKSEVELLFNPGQKMKIKEVKDNGGRIEIVADLIK